MAKVYNLTPDEAERLDRLVATGDYPSREAVVSAGLDLLELGRWNTMVAKKAAESSADIAAGRLHDADEVFDELLARYRNWPK